MHVLTKKPLVVFWNRYPDSEGSLTAWHREMRSGKYTTFHELRAVFPKADKVGNKIVFNVGGNKYRLIAAIHFNRGKVFVRHVLTHKEYDEGKWKDG
ncbi:MAG: type II toxin-antitoxin system HigB family toxin [Candidatus Omnitrophica bacterium]|nr:type II toxin-antitoxin system HigB family toxin [Candidatus Omnitrophota bacterium]